MGPGTSVRRVFAIAALAALVLPQAIFGQREEALPERYAIELVDPTEIEAAAASRTPHDFPFLGETLLLEPVDLRSYRFRATAWSQEGRRTVYKSPPKTFKGTVLGAPESVVRLSITKDGVRGYVRVAEDWTFIRPMPRSAALEEGEHMVFTLDDLGESVVGTCAAVRPLGSEAFVAPGESSPAASSSPDVAAAELGLFELAVDADFEYFVRYGTDSVAEIESVLNEVDGIFQAELGLQIDLVYVNVWEDPSDPYTSTDPGTLLDELRTHWAMNMSTVSRDAVHLMTGKDLDGLTVGLAFLDAVCKSFGYGLTQDLSPASLVPMVVAHELGHNLGSDHDATGTTPRYIMYPSISTTNLAEYSAGSKAQISSYLSTVSCVETVPGSLPPPTSPGGGGGGGPVDPLLFVVLGAALAYRRARSHEPR